MYALPDCPAHFGGRERDGWNMAARELAHESKPIREAAYRELERQRDREPDWNSPKSQTIRGALAFLVAINDKP